MISIKDFIDLYSRTKYHMIIAHVEENFYLEILITQEGATKYQSFFLSFLYQNTTGNVSFSEASLLASWVK